MSIQMKNERVGSQPPLQEFNARQIEMSEAMEKQWHTEPEILHPIIPDLWVEITINPRIIGVPGS